VLRLHVGSDMMAAPIRMPADPLFGLEEIPLENRSMAMEAETRYLLRETTDGPPALAIAVRTLFALLAAAWIASMLIGGRRILEQPATADQSSSSSRSRASLKV
jgi:hypothetical protein